jgi:UDP-glucuronate 4-epimerase
VLLRDEKLLVTGATAAIGFPMAPELAKDNEVWALARFSAPRQRDDLQSLGIRCVQKTSLRRS